MSNEKNPEQLKPNYWYKDDDCNDYIHASIDSGALLNGLAEDKTYLLDQTSNKDGKKWHVLRTDTVNAQAGVPEHQRRIDYYLDHDKQPDTKIEILEYIIGENEFKGLKNSIEINNLIKKMLKQFKLSEDTQLEGVVDVLEMILNKNTDEEKKETLKAELDKLKKIEKEKRASAVDTFDEIVEILEEDTAQNFKILFQCNLGVHQEGKEFNGAHWVLGEIQIAKDAEGNCNVKIFAHHPEGGGQMTAENFERIRIAVDKRLKAIGLQNINITNEKSPFGRRQADSASCGVIVSEDLVLLANGKDLPKVPYPAGAVKLREKQLKTIKDLRGEAPVEAREKSEVELPSPKAASPKEIQAIRDTRRTLESVGYSSDKIKEKNGNLTVKHNKDEINITRTPLAHKITTESTDAGTLTEMVRMAAAMIDEFNKNKNPDQKIEKSINIKPADEAARGILMKACQDHGLKFNVESEPAAPVEAEEEVPNNLNGPAIRNM